MVSVSPLVHARIMTLMYTNDNDDGGDNNNDVGAK